MLSAGSLPDKAADHLLNDVLEMYGGEFEWLIEDKNTLVFSRVVPKAKRTLKSTR